jgi:hypothetical protein
MDKEMIMSNQQDGLIKELVHRLGHLAMQWRGLYLKERQKEETAVIEEYHSIFAQLWALGWDGGDLLPDSELPDELMPKYFIEKWEKKK